MGRRKTKHEIDVETYSTEKDVNDLRCQFLEELEGKDWTDLYDPRDVQRLKDDDFYCKRFIRHQHGDMNAAVKMVKNTFKWRKDKNINDLSETDINPDIVKIGAVFSYNTDKEGNTLLVLRVNCHRKDPVTMPERRKIVAYWVEKLEKEGKSVSVLMDCSDSSLTNMDVDFTVYLISLFTTYYPALIGKIYVLEMPWIMNTCWKIIKTLLPSGAKERIHFLTKSSFSEFLDPKDLPPHLGGTCPTEYAPAQLPTYENDDSRLSDERKNSVPSISEGRDQKA